MILTLKFYKMRYTASLSLMLFICCRRGDSLVILKFINVYNIRRLYNLACIVSYVSVSLLR